MLLQQEYDEIIDALGGPGAAFYKFFAAFSAKGTVIKFGGRISAVGLEEETVDEFRSFIKTQKEWVREARRPPKEMEQRMWWMVCKLFDYNVFSIPDHKYVMSWYSICSDQFSAP
jgi:hypothetical protein